MSAAFRPAAPMYPLYFNLVPLVGGLIDPIVGLFAETFGAFWPWRVPSQADSPRRRRRGLALVLGGIEGPSLYSYAMCGGLLRSGYRGAVVRFPWNAGAPVVRSLRNLTGGRHHERQAAALAQLIVDHHRRYPAAAVCLLAQSGGCWIVLRALARLPPDMQVHAAVLLAPSVSPGFDVTVAASRCRRGLYSIGGPGDFFFLGLGTLALGTSDRVHSPSAGLVGWHHHPAGFVELRWHPDWLRLGYLGNHTTTSAIRFIERVVAPLLVQQGRGPCGESEPSLRTACESAPARLRS